MDKTPQNTHDYLRKGSSKYNPKKFSENEKAHLDAPNSENAELVRYDNRPRTSSMPAKKKTNSASYIERPQTAGDHDDASSSYPSQTEDYVPKSKPTYEYEPPRTSTYSKRKNTMDNYASSGVQTAKAKASLKQQDDGITHCARAHNPQNYKTSFTLEH